MKQTFRMTVAILTVTFMFAGTIAAVMPVSPPVEPSVQNSEALTFELLYDVGSKTRYESDIGGYGNIAFDFKREIALARLSYGDFFVSGGWTRDARIEPAAETYYPMPLERSAAYGFPHYEEPEDPTGDGFIVTAGLRNQIWRRDQFALHAYGELDFRRESYDATSTYVSSPVYAAEPSSEIYPPPDPVPEPKTYTETYDIKVHGTELSAGLVGAFAGKRYTLYAGMELLAFSDIEADVDVTSSDGSNYSDTSDVDRADSVSFLLGLKASFNRGFLLVETRALGATNLRVGAGVSF